MKINSLPVYIISILLVIYSPGSHSEGLSVNKIKVNNPERKVSHKWKTVDNVVRHAIQDSSFPGAVLMVGQNGKIIHEKAFGHYMYDFKSGKVSLKSMYDLASLTKVIATTTATMICFDRGMIKLDDKVAKYFPQFAVHGKENVTIRNLLVHDSGLRPDIKSIKAYDSVSNKENAVMSEIFQDSLIYPTGTKMVYSDLNFILLGKIIEKVTGKSLDKFCEESTFKPLHMKSTMFNPAKNLTFRIAPTENDNQWRKRLIRGEVHDETSALLGGVAGHAGLFSDAGDIAKLLQILLQKGNYNGRQIIKSKTVELFVKKQSELSSRALGWDTKSPQGSSAGSLFSDLSYGHTGFTGTSVWTDPSRNLFVIFLTNRVFQTRNNSRILKVRPLLHDEVIRAVDR